MWKLVEYLSKHSAITTGFGPFWMRDKDGVITEVGNVDISGYQNSPPKKWPP